MNEHTQQVARVEEQAGSVVTSESASVLNLIERAARDPNVDIDKMERLMQMQTQVIEREAKKAFNAAMVAAQTEMRPVAADANNPQTRSKYASYAALDRALRPIYTAHGFALTFDTGEAPEGYLRVQCDISHGDGHTKTVHIDMPADGKGAKGGDVMTKTHAAGSAASYGMRYLLKMIFNVAVGEGDDDGNGAGGPLVLNAAQAKLFINFDKIVETIRTMPTFKRLHNLRDFIPRLTFVHESTRAIWLEECEAREAELDAALSSKAKGEAAPDFAATLAEAVAAFGAAQTQEDVSELDSEFGSRLDGMEDWGPYNEALDAARLRVEG